MEFYNWREDWQQTSSEVEEYIRQNGVSNIGEFLRVKLNRWQNVEVNIGITGDAGAGKSSFINAIRGINVNNPKAAPVGVTECTEKKTSYDYPSNPKVKFWDLPGFGTRKRSQLDAYCKEVELEKYQAFLIFTKDRFTEMDGLMAEKIVKMGKQFFFIRAKIDIDLSNEQEKNSFNEEAMLKEIRTCCRKNLGDSLKNEEYIFLISNTATNKWDFDRLRQAILDAMPEYEQQSLTLTLNHRSTDMLKRKVEVLKWRVKVVAALSGAIGTVPVPGVSIGTDIGLILYELSLYKSQLGIPEEGSERFSNLSNNTQKAVKAVLAIMNGISHATLYSVRETVEEVTRAIPIVGWLAGGAMSWAGTYYFLAEKLGEMERVAFLVLQEAFATDNH